MTEMELKSMSFGWEWSELQDNIEYIIQTEDGTQYELMASIQQLAILYDSIENKEDRSFFMGTGTPIEIQHQDENVQITIGNTTVSETSDTICEKLDGLLTEVFNRADQKDPLARDRNLKRINEHLREHYSGLDFKSLYDELINGP